MPDAATMDPSALGGIDPSQIQGLLAQFAPDKTLALRQALMAAGFGLMGAVKGGEGQAASKAGLLGLDAYNSSLTNQLAQQKSALEVGQGGLNTLLAMKRAGIMLPLFQAAASRAQADMAGQGSPPAAQSPMPVSTNGAQQPFMQPGGASGLLGGALGGSMPPPVSLPTQQAPQPPQAQSPMANNGAPGWATPSMELAMSLGGQKDTAEAIHRNFIATVSRTGVYMVGGQVRGQFTPDGVGFIGYPNGPGSPGVFMQAPPDALAARAAQAGQVAGAEAAGKAGQDLVMGYVGDGTPQGTHEQQMTRAQAVARANGQPPPGSPYSAQSSYGAPASSGPAYGGPTAAPQPQGAPPGSMAVQPGTPPPWNVPQPTMAAANGGRLATLQGELARLQSLPDSPQKAQNIAAITAEMRMPQYGGQPAPTTGGFGVAPNPIATKAAEAGVETSALQQRNFNTANIDTGQKQLEELQAARMSALKVIPALDNLERTDDKGIYTGSPQQVYKDAAMWINSIVKPLGINIDTSKITNSDTYYSAMQVLGRANLKQFPGGKILQNEFSSTIESLPSAATTPEGRAAIRAQMGAAALDTINQTQSAEQYFNPQSGLNGWKPPTTIIPSDYWKSRTQIMGLQPVPGLQPTQAAAAQHALQSGSPAVLRAAILGGYLR